MYFITLLMIFHPIVTTADAVVAKIINKFIELFLHVFLLIIIIIIINNINNKSKLIAHSPYLEGWYWTHQAKD